MDAHPGAVEGNEDDGVDHTRRGQHDPGQATVRPPPAGAGARLLMTRRSASHRRGR
jgi:hypothetical protein